MEGRLSIGVALFRMVHAPARHQTQCRQLQGQAWSTVLQQIAVLAEHQLAELRAFQRVHVVQARRRHQDAVPLAPDVALAAIPAIALE